MGLTSALKNKLSLSSESTSDVATKEIAEEFKVGEITDEDCAGCSHACFPSSLKIDQEPLYNSAPKTYAQILVATGKHNWLHDIGDEPHIWGKICKTLSASAGEISAVAGGKVRINGTDMDFDEGDEKVTVVILPQFIKIQTTPETCLKDVKAVLRVKPSGSLGEGMTVLKDLGYILICSHRTRDKRCGITAPLMKTSLDIELRNAGLYRDVDDDDTDGVRVIMCNHVGGHKFAANALIYKNNGTAVMFARLRPEHARAVVEKTIENDILFPDYTRSFNKLEAYKW